MKTKYATSIYPIFDNIEYRYRLLLKKGKENRQIGALGYYSGFVSACYYYPQTDMNIIVFENTAKKLRRFQENL